ncbi:MAG TPA: RES family NAD+ phosphorylase [Acetobacteraceae bacterium]|jgi:RES domain-containing protein
MRVWRLAAGQYREIDGEGARIYGGRWNSPGVPVVYAATHVSLALLEQLVHVDPEDLPDTFRAFAIDLPDDLVVEAAASSVLPGDPETCRRYGDDWAGSRRSGALVVPSTLVAPRLQPGSIETTERNVLLNPRHASADTWRVVETSFSIDPRLKRTG